MKQCLRCGKVDPPIDLDGRCGKKRYLASSYRGIGTSNTPTCGGTIIEAPKLLNTAERVRVLKVRNRVL